MTSLKRSFDSIDQPSSLQYDSIPSSQNSSLSPPAYETLYQPDHSIDGWGPAWDEVIGVPRVHAGGLQAAEGDGIFPDEQAFSSMSTIDDAFQPWPGDSFGTFSTYSPVEPLSQSTDNTEYYGQGHDICFGMIYRAKAKLEGNMSEVCRKLAVATTKAQTHFVLNVICTDTGLSVVLSDGSHLARLNVHLADALVEEVRSGTIRLEALVSKRNIFEDISTATREKDAHTVLNINVYGSSLVQTTIGHMCSNEKIWLQRPDWLSPNTKYDNPHTLKFDSGNEEERHPLVVEDEALLKNADLQQSMDEVYSMLTRDSHLKGLSGDARLRTSLFEHQGKALDFMMQRETGPIPDGFELWETVIQDSETWYHHKVAGIKSRSLPSEVGGGILADEMGMGKTFCVLALVVGTLRDAHSWSNDDGVHLAEGISPTKILSRATLVVVPSPLLLSTWQSEIKDRLDVPPKVLIHHGNERPKDPKIMADNDIVLTTYHTLIADYTRKKPIANEVAWYRVVLDEAHFIRRMTTSLHKRVAELDAKFRWCLTGTPIQNTLDDLGSLFAFIRIFPFDRLGVFRKFISVPFKEGGSMRADGQHALARLFDAMCIRRTKEHLKLAGSTEAIHPVSLSPNERAQYDKTSSDMNRALRNLAGDYESRNKFSLFHAQLQLRLICNHGTFQRQFHWARSRNSRDAREFVLTAAGSDGEIFCSGCTQMVPGILSSRALHLLPACKHVLCSECNPSPNDGCPLCAADFSSTRRSTMVMSGPHSIDGNGYFNSGGFSSKLAALVQDLIQTSPDDKSIVFTCWTTTLDLVGWHLNQHNIRHMRVDGEHALKHRETTLQQFETDPRVRVLIMTTGVGALGLNIIAANQVFLLEPQWNPSVEAQAIGRTIRIGQHKAVHVTRYIVKGTVEEDIQQLQSRKRGIAKMTSQVKASDSMSIKQEHFGSLI
ncbi:hypothetical protein LTR84_011582 [Exophiala bonariae]|uniref:Uncharacterized protein n=1 Tax=Exophiala bonariae TaxID=1690606 RepID=A0AAV9NGW0_9EURO|nr:hypothetical protein LTR84_011582 [Exophiala bonariae]